MSKESKLRIIKLKAKVIKKVSKLFPDSLIMIVSCQFSKHGSRIKLIIDGQDFYTWTGKSIK